MKGLLRITSVFCFAMVVAMPRLALAQEAAVDEDSEIVNLMHDRLTHITSIRANLIMGNLDGVREPANWLAEHDDLPGLPTQFEQFVDILRMFAEEVLEAPDIESAAGTVSMMAQNCGNCHMANAVGLRFGYDQLPADWADTQTHMQRHQWAVDRMWEGLIGPSVSAWDRGASMLGGEPLHSDYIAGIRDPEEAAAVNKIAARVHELGRIGADASNNSARGDVYGEMISLCADCHIRLGQGPGQ